ncbi:uncharacterized protein LOC101039884 isoform X2 [Saimiri boliviensis]|uniref:uncharacterized protein LOC101039884 isoform X2 n=1 Tax=Saimiri boliviensis TaxID=27679 RepID=UPI003D785D6C
MPRDDPCTGGNGCARISQSENGMARCACHTGYQLSEDKNTCKGIELEIVNSCEKNNGGCSHHCEHAIGAPCCSCNHGYQLDSDEKTCIACSLETNEKECGSICNCQNGGTCDLLTRLSQGYLRSWLLFRMSVCGGEHPGMQCQKW